MFLPAEIFQLHSFADQRQERFHRLTMTFVAENFLFARLMFPLIDDTEFVLVGNERLVVFDQKFLRLNEGEGREEEEEEEEKSRYAVG